MGRNLMLHFFIKRLGKYFYYWILQAVFFLGLAALPILFEEGAWEEWMMGFLIFIIMANTILPILLVFLYARAWIVDTQKRWVYFAISILVVSAIGSFAIIMLEGESITYDYFFMFWGLIGSGLTLILQPFAHSDKRTN